MFENVDRVREEIEMYIVMRIGNYIEFNEENDFYYNGIDVSFEGGIFGFVWFFFNLVFFSRVRMILNYRNDSFSFLGSGFIDFYFGSNRLVDFSLISLFSIGNFWFGDILLFVGLEDFVVDFFVFDFLLIFV